MTEKKQQPAYRTTVLPGLGQVDVPAGLSDAEVLAEAFGPDAVATPDEKTQKKP